MNKDYLISWDSTSDIPNELLCGDYDIINMNYVLDGVLYDGVVTPFLSNGEFYSKLKNGASVSTSLVSESHAEEFFEKHLLQGKDILHISFSSGMSGTYESYLKAKKNLESKYPNQKIVIIDSKAATGGQGLLCYYALLNRENGMTIEENEKQLLSIRDNIVHLFTVDDMHHLYRGGRITKAKAVVATLAHIKPLLCVNEEGKLASFNKAPGSKLAVKALADKMISLTKGFENKVIFITYSGSPLLAESLKEKLKSISNNTYILEYSQIIGAHLGYGALAFFALGQTKNIK